MSERTIVGGDSELVKRVDCTSCAALCCRSTVQNAMKFRLTADELAFMRAGGTEMTQVEAAPPRRRFLPILQREPRAGYRMEGDCGYLAPGAAGEFSCSAHEDPNRPQPCGDFMPGTYNCRLLRVIGGVDTPQEFATFLEVTGQEDAPVAPAPHTPPQNPPMAA